MPTIAQGTVLTTIYERHIIRLRLFHLSGRIMSTQLLPILDESIVSIDYSPTDRRIAAFLSKSIYIIDLDQDSCIKLYDNFCIDLGVYSPCGTNIIIGWANKIKLLSTASATTLFEFSLAD